MTAPSGEGTGDGNVALFELPDELAIDFDRSATKIAAQLLKQSFGLERRVPAKRSDLEVGRAD